jgi:hypothetical protein
MGGLYVKNFERRREQNHGSAYAMHDWKRRAHHARLRRFIDAMAHKLVCQDCGGSGEFLIEAIEYGRGPMAQCSWCEGLGYVTPHVRGRWLRYNRRSKAQATAG